MPPLRSKLSIKWIMPPLMILPVIKVSLVLITLDYSTGLRSIDELADAPFICNPDSDFFPDIEVPADLPLGIAAILTLVVIKFTPRPTPPSIIAEPLTPSVRQGDSP